MKKVFLIIGIAALALFVLFIVAGIGLFSKRNEIIRAGTERVLTLVLDVPCTVAGADLKIRDQRVTLSGIVIGAPEGYTAAHSMKFDSVSVQVDIGSFRGNDRVINQIVIAEPDIIAEVKGTTTNLQVLMANAERYASEPQPDDPTYLIKEVLITRPRASAVIPFSGGQAAGLRLPDITLNDIGGKDESVSPAEALQEILGAILDKVREAGNAIFPSEVLNSMRDTLNSLPGELQRNLDNIQRDIRGLFGGGTSDGSGVVDETRQQLEAAATDVQEAARDVAEGAEQTLRDATTQAEQAAQSVTTEVQQATQSATEQASQAAQQLQQEVERATQEGRTSIGGLLRPRATATPTATPAATPVATPSSGPEATSPTVTVPEVETGF